MRFLDRKQQVPVTAASMFVGRRAELQQSLRALRSGRRAGVLLHGQGRLGKSSLAARIADRCPDLAVAVVFGDYSALAILDAIAAAVRANPAARQLIEARLPEVRQQPGAVEGVLVDLLAGPLAQAGDGRQRPLLLVIDDLEQVLAADPAGPHRVAPGYAPVLAGVLRAFDPAETDSRLLVTSRFTFTLDGLEDRLEAVALRPLSPVGQHKLQRRQEERTPPERQAGRAELVGRAVAVSRGNPGLQDLAVLRLVYGEQVSPERAEAAVAGMEAYLRQGDLPADAEVREFLENLALDALLQQGGAAGVALLRAATLFDLPVPEPVIEVLVGAVGGSAARLRGLGLLEPYPDLYDPARLALAADPLAVGRVQPLTAGEQAALAAVSLGPLFTAWGGTAPQAGRDQVLDLQLTRLALAADYPALAAACVLGAVAELRSGPAIEALRLGRDTIALLDRHAHPVPLILLRRAADAALTSGDGQAGQALLDWAVQQAQADDQDAASPLDQARVIAEQARHLLTRGETDQAEQQLRRACQLFTAAGSEGEAATAMGAIADIAFQRGDYDEALRIRREIALPAYERLGDTRSAAVTWGKTADIAYRRGDYDEAADLQRKRLEVNKQLGDLDGIAAAAWDLARIDLERKDYQAAFPQLAESFQIFSRLQRPDGIAAVGWSLGQLLLAAGETDQARQVLGDAAAAAERVGWTGLADQISDLLNSQLLGNEQT